MNLGLFSKKIFVTLFVFLFVLSCSSPKDTTVKTKISSPGPVKKTAEPNPECVKIRQNQYTVRLSHKLDIIPESELLPNYVERMRLNNRTLARQRYKTVIYGEKRASRERFYLAVLLWRLSVNKEAELGERPDKSSSESEILNYRKKIRKIESYRRESLFHLDYLVKRKKVSPAILERWAYYYAVLQGTKAIPRFYRLFAYPKVPDKRYYTIDFANLLIAAGRCDEASAILSAGVPSSHRKRRYATLLKLKLCKLGNSKDDISFWIKQCRKVPTGMFPLLARYMATGLILAGLDSDSVMKDVEKSCGFKSNHAYSALWRHSWKIFKNKIKAAGLKKIDKTVNLKNPRKLIEFLSSLLNVYAFYIPRLDGIKLIINDKSEISLKPVGEMPVSVFNIFKSLLKDMKPEKMICADSKHEIIVKFLR